MKKAKKILSVFLVLLMMATIIPMSSITASAASLVWPVPGHTNLSQGFHSEHAGIDISDGSIGGADVVAAMGGTVTNIYTCVENHQNFGDCGGFGTGVIIRGDDGRWYQYAHMQGYSIPSNVYVGAYVPAGAKVGKVGNTGYSTGNHLHFQINTTNAWNGPVNPQAETYSGQQTSYFTSVWADGITENDATIHATITGTNLSTCGFYIGKSESAMEKRTETVNGYVENIWYTLSSDYGTLQPGTTYYYKFFVTVGGTEYCSDVKTFKTSGKTYTLSYDANGGSGAPASQTGTDWATMTVSSTKPTRTGYTFLGWSEYKKDTTAPYLPGSRFLITKNITLYAVWEANTYSVKYNANGGSGTMSNSSHTYNVSKELTSNVFTRSGYTFLGWSTSSTATSATYTDGQSVKNLTATNGGTVNLYAVWQKNPVTVSSISIATKPTKTEYYVGDTFNSSGLSIKVTMSDGTTQTLTSGFTVSSPNMSTAGTKTVTVTYSGKTASFTINVNEKPVTPENPDTDYTISIRTPSRTTIRYKDGIILHANVEGELPEGASVVWYVSNDNFEGGYLDDGMSCVFVSANNGYTTIYAVIEDANGNELAVDSIELRSNAGFFQKIGGFFRSLFGNTTIYEY